MSLQVRLRSRPARRRARGVPMVAGGAVPGAETRRRRPLVRALTIPLIAAIGVLGACGDDSGDAGGEDDGGADGVDEESSGDAEAGEALFNSKGCSGCHNGNVAPDLEGVYMEDVELEDGSTVVADDEYLERSIRDPGADIVADATIKMPEIPLSDEEIEQLVAYIRELGS